MATNPVLPAAAKGSNCLGNKEMRPDPTLTGFLGVGQATANSVCAGPVVDMGSTELTVTLDRRSFRQAGRVTNTRLPGIGLRI